MATILPEILLNPHRAKSELDVLDVIRKKVSDDWVVFQGFEFRTYSRKFRRDFSFSPHSVGAQPTDGEIDFVFFKAGVGFVVLEVKGGEITFSDSTWFQNGSPIAPFQQARRGAYFLRDLLRKKLGSRYSYSFSYAVCFPDVCRRFAPNELPPDASGYVITRPDLDSLGTQIGVMLERRWEQAKDPEVPGLPLEEAKKVLSPIFDYHIPLADLITRDNAKLLELTEEQYRLFHAMRQIKRLRVRGCAGSGKTLMAIKKARELAEDGKRVAVFCFNTILAGEIADAVSDSGGAIVADALLEFCAKKAGIPAAEIARHRDDTDFWEREVPDRWRDEVVAKGTVPSFDAVLIDEGQDFTGSAWEMIESIVGDDPSKIFYVFYDPMQNVFQRDLDRIPGDPAEEVLLEKNCRSTRAICTELEKIGGQRIEVAPETPAGREVVRVKVADEKEAVAAIHEEIRRLAREEGQLDLHEKLVILGAHQYRHTPFHAAPRIPGSRYSIADGLSGGKTAIPYLTSMKFKGCDRPIVFLYDVDSKDPVWSIPGNLYTAASRASHLLYLFSREEGTPWSPPPAEARDPLREKKEERERTLALKECRGPAFKRQRRGQW